MTPNLSERFNAGPGALLSLLLACGLGFASTANAAICRVDTVGGGSGNSWSQPIALQPALISASCSEIWIKAGTYTPGGMRTDSFNILPGIKVMAVLPAPKPHSANAIQRPTSPPFPLISACPATPATTTTTSSIWMAPRLREPLRRAPCSTASRSAVAMPMALFRTASAVACLATGAEQATNAAQPLPMSFLTATTPAAPAVLRMAVAARCTTMRSGRAQVVRSIPMSSSGITPPEGMAERWSTTQAPKAPAAPS